MLQIEIYPRLATEYKSVQSEPSYFELSGFYDFTSFTIFNIQRTIITDA